MAGLDSLYRGALIGESLSKQLGIATATGEDVQTAQRIAYLQSGVATGKLNPGSLSKPDSQLLQRGLQQSGQVNEAGIIGRPSWLGKSNGGLLDTLLFPVKVATNTAGDLVNAAESLPTGIYTVGKSLAKTGQELTDTLSGTKSDQPIGGPDILGLLGNMAKATAGDFTHFDPTHPLYPAMDIAAVLSGGASTAARLSTAIARTAETGRALEAGEQVGRLGQVSGRIGRLPPIQKISGPASRLSKALIGAERPAVPITGRAADLAAQGIRIPELPMRYYSTSPFRRLFVEKPLERLFTGKLARVQLPLFPEKTGLMDLRGAYHVRKAQNVLWGRAASASLHRLEAATKGFNIAMQHLIDTSVNQTEASRKFDALVLLRELGGENMTPAERLDLLEEYRNKVLATGPTEVNLGEAKTPEADKIREFNRKLTRSADYIKFFTEPDEAAWRVRDEWDKAIVEGLKQFHISPHEILRRVLGPLAHIRDSTPEELLREQPENVQRSMNFARMAHDVEQELIKSGGGDVPEEANAYEMAKFLPDTPGVSGHERVKLVRHAIESLKADIEHIHTGRDLLNNAQAIDYLPGKNLAAKVANAMPERLGIAPEVAEPFSYGGMTNYFPQASARYMKIRPEGGIINRRLAALKAGLQRGEYEIPERLQEYRRENMARTLKPEVIGVGPFAGFLQEADMRAFAAGIDRRDPAVLLRHIAQRERVLVHRMLSAPLVEKLAIKDAEGNVIYVANDSEKAEVMGSQVLADKYTIISPRALEIIVDGENQAAKDVANLIKTRGGITPEALKHIETIIAENGLETVRELADEVISQKGKGIILPNSFVDNFIKRARTLDTSNRGLVAWQAFINKWRTVVLAYMPSWLLRTTVGHGFILFLSGVWNPIHYTRAIKYFGNGWSLPGGKAQLFEGLGREVPYGVDQGMPHSEFGRIGQKQFSKNIVKSSISGGVHTIANFQRRAAFISIMNRVVRAHMAELGDAFDLPRELRSHERLDYIIEHHPEVVHHVLNELDRVSYTFGQMSPWERRLAKNIIPFWGWYKFVSKFVWTLPFTYPGRALAVVRLGQIGESEQGLLGPMPDWLRASIMFDTHNLAAVKYMSMLGLNPLGDVANPGEGLQGLVRMGQLSPIIQAGLSAMGYDTLTGGFTSSDPGRGDIVEVNGKYFNIQTGEEVDSPGVGSVQDSVLRFFGQLARSFPEVRIAEQAATGGKPVYPESIPFVDEHYIPTTNQPKDVSPLGLLAMYSGLAVKNYNLSKYQYGYWTDLQRALSEHYNKLAEEKAIK